MLVLPSHPLSSNIWLYFFVFLPPFLLHFVLSSFYFLLSIASLHSNFFILCFIPLICLPFLSSLLVISCVYPLVLFSFVSFIRFFSPNTCDVFSLSSSSLFRSILIFPSTCPLLVPSLFLFNKFHMIFLLLLFSFCHSFLLPIHFFSSSLLFFAS